MKKSIFAIVAFMVIMLTACTSQVESDIQSVVTDSKVYDVKSADINGGFFLYTHEYQDNYEKGEMAKAKAENSRDRMDFYFEMARDYADLKRWDSSLEKLHTEYYNDYKKWQKQLEEDLKAVKEYNTIHQNFLDNGAQNGKVYVAKIKGINEYTKKPMDFYSYQLYTYDSDGSIHQIDNEHYMEIVCSLYPKAKEDFAKAMNYGMSAVIDALSNLSL